CVVAGDYYTEPDFADTPIFEDWNGRTWTIQDDTLPAGLDSLGATSVSCPSSSTCFAAAFTTSGLDSTAMVMQSQGGVWGSPIAVPRHGPDDVLGRISCVRVGVLDHCTAVGYYTFTPDGAGHAMAVSYNGQHWVDQETANPILGRSLLAVSCVPHGTCTAVGSYYNRGTNASYLAEQN
ncbi:MAG: hypothetical protein ACRDNF_12040, partial [Streptosporangiaceae bacterium]